MYTWCCHRRSLCKNEHAFKGADEFLWQSKEIRVLEFPSFSFGLLFGLTFNSPSVISHWFTKEGMFEKIFKEGVFTNTKNNKHTILNSCFIHIKLFPKRKVVWIQTTLQRRTLSRDVLQDIAIVNKILDIHLQCICHSSIRNRNLLYLLLEFCHTHRINRDARSFTKI